MKNRIKELSKIKKIKIDVLAQKANVSRTTIYSIARGSSIPTIESAYKISKALKVPIQKVFLFNEDEKEER